MKDIIRFVKEKEEIECEGCKEKVEEGTLINEFSEEKDDGKGVVINFYCISCLITAAPDDTVWVNEKG